jgi:F-type H+-transporting ATPase subunit b
MLIDWFTVGAQALNFIILVWLLKRLLYKPILDALDARETRIAAELADADARRTEALAAQQEFREKNLAIDHQRIAFLAQARAEASAERQRILELARQAADALSARRAQELQEQARQLTQGIRDRMQQEIFAIARKTLADLADCSLEERMSELFAARVRAMDADAKAALAKIFRTMSAPALVRSAFELPTPERARIQKAINDAAAMDVALRFETASGLVGGIELSAQGNKLAWSIADYLTSMEASIGELLEAQHPSGSDAVATAPDPGRP